MNPETPVSKPVVAFTAQSWLKMVTLVDQVDTEIGWHGIVECDKEQNYYTIRDILVYPQTVSGATVTTDAQTYGEWLMHFEDEIFNNIRLQGHSHVRMGVTPSGVDDFFYDSILKNLDQDDYYIFLIINKYNTFNIWIYDYSRNTIYDKDDISVIVLGRGGDIASWANRQIAQNVSKFGTTAKKDDAKKDNITVFPSNTDKTAKPSLTAEEKDLIDRYGEDSLRDPFYNAEGYRGQKKTGAVLTNARELLHDTNFRIWLQFYYGDDYMIMDDTSIMTLYKDYNDGAIPARTTNTANRYLAREQAALKRTGKKKKGGKK
jgi:hypothetical protein